MSRSERHYVHRLPGRIRVRSCRLREAGRLAQIERLLAALPGPVQTRAEPFTGSLLVLHDPARVDGDAILALLADAGALDLEAAARDGGRIHALAERAAHRAVQAAARGLLGALA